MANPNAKKMVLQFEDNRYTSLEEGTRFARVVSVKDVPQRHDLIKVVMVMNRTTLEASFDAEMAKRNGKLS